MIPIDSTHLKMLPEHFTAQDRHQFLTNISISRVYSYSKNSTRLVENSITVPLLRVYSSYFVTPMTFGTEGGILRTYLLLDTASPETWVQCEGCNPCIQVNQKDFSYTESPRYQKMRPDDPMCYPQLAYSEGSCGFDITYGLISQTRTIGFVGRDVFYFQRGHGSDLYPYPGIAFGCALHIENFQLGDNTGPNNIIAGVHGLAPGPRSFLTQLASQIRGQFSYCLVSSTMHIKSYIYFGDDAHISGDDATQVQTISMYNVEKYHLYLNGISVDGSRVPIDLSIFELDDQLYTKGFFIDSGAPFTVLARSAYNPLKQAMIHYFRNNYGWQPIIETGDQYPLCYSNFPSGSQRFPSMILHFAKGQSEEIDWILDKDNIFLRRGNDGFCIMIYVTDDPGPNLFGAFQQVNFNILYDVNNGLLSFVPKRCHEMTI